MGLIGVTMANPNGDPGSGNAPRQDLYGYGIMSDVCIKRKLRNRLQDMGQTIFVQSEDRADDGCKSLKQRMDRFCPETGDKEAFIKEACKKFFDVRAFGSVFAFKGADRTAGIRGPVSIQHAVSVNPVNIFAMQITKSANGSDVPNGKKASDTMGMKYLVDYGLYIVKGSISAELAHKTGFSQEDANCLKEAFRTLFVNDASSARPEGSMEVHRLYWWQHHAKTPGVTAAMVHSCVAVTPNTEEPRQFADYTVKLAPLDGAAPEIYGNP